MLLRSLALGLVATLVAGCVIGVVLRLTVRDGWQPLATLYYATPPPLVALVTAGAAVVAWRMRSRRWATAFVLATIGCAAWFVASSRFAADQTEARQADLRVALWNVGRGTFGWSGLAERLAALDADVLCLVESRCLEQHDAKLRASLPGYTILYVEGGFTILSRVPVHEAHAVALPRGRACRASIGSARRLELVLVDVPSDPFGPRGPSIDRARAAVPDLLLGDFNTPRASVHFEALRGDYTHAFEAAGSGFVETWPWFLPVLDLDHVWVRAALRVRACNYERSSCSDHCAVIVDLDFV